MSQGTDTVFNDPRTGKRIRLEGAHATMADLSLTEILTHYECGPVRFAGDENASYERHLVHDHVIDPRASSTRERFEAVAFSLRDLLSKRWIKTRQTHDRENPKRVYYLSMEFLIGRSLTNNITNLRVEPLVREAMEREGLDLMQLAEMEPDAGLGNGGLGRLAACFIDSLATLRIPAYGYGLRYEYGIFRQEIQNGYQVESPDHWLYRPDPWEVMRPSETVEVELNVSVESRDGRVVLVPGQRMLLLGIPYDRPVVGYGGNTINTLRLWGAGTPLSFDLGRFSSGDLIGSQLHQLAAESLIRVLYPDDSIQAGQTLRFIQEYFLVACSLADIVGPVPPEQRQLARPAGKGRHPAQRHPPGHRRRRADAHPARQGGAGLGRRVGPDHPDPRLHEPHPAPRGPGEVARLAVRAGHSPAPGDHLRDQPPVPRRRAGEYPDDARHAQRMSLIEEGAVKKVRMANLAIVGTHSTNGVAELHTDLIRERLVPDFAAMFPERFGSQTNGVTPRRWLLMANPSQSNLISEAIGDGWITDLEQLRDLVPLADDAGFRDRFRQAKQRGQGALRGLAPRDDRRGRRSRHDLRLPDQANP